MKNNNKTFFNRNGTFLKLVNNNLLVLNSDTLDRDTFAIRVCNNFYIELGRPLQDFKEVLMEADIPIVFERIGQLYGYTHYSILRMETDDVEDLVLGTIICKDGIIEKLTCDSTYKARADFNKYDSIGAIWKGGSFNYGNSQHVNKDTAKRITLALLSLNMHTTKKEINDNFLFSPLAMGSEAELDLIRNKIRKDNIEAEFESGDIESAYELIEDEIDDTDDDMSDFETIDDLSMLFEDVNKFKDNFEKDELGELDTDFYDTESETLGNIEIDITYSTIKIEVTLTNTDNNKKYKFTFILNEISRMYELISITLI